MRPPPTRSSSENSRPRWNSNSTRPSAASSSRSSGCSTRTMPGVAGPNTMPASMKNGIVGSPIFRPNRASRPAARNAPPTATSVSPTGRPDHVTGERGQVLGPATDPEPVSGPQHLGGHGRDDRASVAGHGHDRHARAAPDLELGDAAVGTGRVGPQRHPVDEDVADHGIHLVDHGGREVGAAQHGAQRACLAVGQGERRPGDLGLGRHDVQVSPARVVDDDDSGAAVAAGQAVAAADARKFLLFDLGVHGGSSRWWPWARDGTERTVDARASPPPAAWSAGVAGHSGAQMRSLTAAGMTYARAARYAGRRPRPGYGNSAPAGGQLQPLVLPQDGHAWQEPARCICTPHCMQYGASAWVTTLGATAGGPGGPGSL